MTALPVWPPRSVAVLATLAAPTTAPTTTPTVPDAAPQTASYAVPHVVPVSAPVRAGDAGILLSLHRAGRSLARLRERPQVALLVLPEDGAAFTAHGTARIVAEPMAGAPDFAAVEITVTEVDLHRQATVTGDEGPEPAARVAVLRQLAAVRLRCRVAALGRATR
ncbi:pyridoxamine 5'-phosphate oxidase family protein [Streptacidiphilus sp. EB129]|uniref:pyridoxamine 5'-phosphate oxidase family protein n=1 Tax=Streptacidiphilus sp. EB129 TaxID=3156262 RepID=UPI0035197AF0